MALGRVNLETSWARLRSFVSIQRYSKATGTDPVENELVAIDTRQSTHPTPETTQIESSILDNADLAAPFLENPTTSDATRKSQSPTHWIRGVCLCGYATVGLLLVNIVFMSIAGGLASRNPGSGGSSSSKVIYRGSCTVTARWNTGLHVIINVISTCVLAAGNYCMQTLVAPNRDEVNAFHSNRRWLDIGSQSIRNLSAISSKRLGLWVILLLTSTPFHLLYNSMVFQSLSLNYFWSLIGPSDFDPRIVGDLGTPALEKCFLNSVRPSYYVFNNNLIGWDQQVLQITGGKSRKVQLQECYDYFTMGSPSGYKGLVFLSSNLGTAYGENSSLLYPLGSRLVDWKQPESATAFPFVNQNYSAPRGHECVVSNFLTDDDSNSWMEQFGSDAPPDLQTVRLHECLAFEGKIECQLLFSPIIGMIVSIAILIKVTAIFMAARVHGSRSRPLLTVGDAIASFLASPDETTEGMCWASMNNIKMGRWMFLPDATKKHVPQQARPPIYRRLSARKHYRKASSKCRWISSCFFFAMGIIASATVPLVDPEYWPEGIFTGNAWRQLWDHEASARNLMGGNLYSDLQGVIIANAPQLAVTLGYYLYNGLLTKLLSAAEYSAYGAARSPLRVTWPIKGSHQLSTYWLSVPYKYGIPVMVLFTAIHWLVSQAFSYILMIPYGIDDKPIYEARVSQTAYSTGLNLALTTLIGILLAGILVSLAFRKLKSNMPLAGSCSAAISAACHLPEDVNKATAAHGELAWGETDLPTRWEHAQHDGFRKGHCTFTPLDAKRPSLHKLYA